MIERRGGAGLTREARQRLVSSPACAGGRNFSATVSPIISTAKV
jgi:hypothetical protein